MGNHQIYPKRQHRPSESVGFVKQNANHDDDDGRFVTIPKTKSRIQSAPPLNENLVAFESMIFTTPILPFDKSATITGTFTGWFEEPMFSVNGDFQKSIEVPPGCHYYRILVNGRARFRNDETTEDHPKFGRVQFVFVAPADQNVTNPLERTLLALPKLNDWSQETSRTSFDAAPPRIPPHLLNILLNRKLPANCDPHVLPEPNSVTLRHLYALSIQNGMMILSTTIRYKRKFVTLCFYKPI